MLASIVLSALGRRLAQLGAALASMVVLLVATAAALPSTAQAVPFSCGPIAPGSWCIYNVRHSYYIATASYSGIFVCAKLIRDSDASQISQNCNQNYVSTNAAGNELAKPLVQNGHPSGSYNVQGSALY